MNASTSPLHQRCEQRGATSMLHDEPRRSPSQGTNTCICGYIITAPSSSTCTRTGVVNNWQCSACGNEWDTEAGNSVSGRSPTGSRE